VTVKQTVWCSGCGRQLEEPPSTPAGKRIACPDCGSESRKFGAEIPSVAEVDLVVDHVGSKLVSRPPEVDAQRED
jgi:hypothetical protein